MITPRSYRLLPLLVLLAGYNSVYAMQTLARTNALRKALARTYAHAAARRFCTTDQAHTNLKLSSTDSQNNHEQSNSQEHRSNEQRYQAFKNKLYATGAFVAGTSMNSDSKKDKNRALFHALTTGNEETIKALLHNNNLSDDYLDKLLNYAVEHNNYALFSAVLEVLDRKNLGDTAPNNLQKLWNSSHKVVKLDTITPTYKILNPKLKHILYQLENNLECNYFYDTCENKYINKGSSYKQVYNLTRDQLKRAIITAYYNQDDLNIELHYPRREYDDYFYHTSLLHMIVIFQDHELMSLLIKAGINPNVQDKKGKTPLFYVTSSVVAQFLINAGALTNAQNKEGDTPAHIALRNGNIALAQALLSPEVAKIKNQDGKTPLQILYDKCATLSLSSQLTTPELLDQLIQNNRMFAWTQSQLTQVLRNQSNQDCVMLARVLEDLTGDSSKTAGELWRQHTSQMQTLKTDFTDTLIRNKQNYYHAHKQTIQEFTQAGHDINMPVTNDDSTLLHIAIYFNDLETATYLIKNGASVDIRNIHGQTPLFYAYTYDTYKLLKEHGALLTARDTNNRSLLYYAMQHGYDPRLVKEYAHLEQNDPTRAWQYLVDACKDSASQELMAKVQAYLTAAPTSLKNSDIKGYWYNTDNSNCTTLIEILKKLAQQTTP